MGRVPIVSLGAGWVESFRPSIYCWVASMPLWGGMIASKHHVHFRHSASEMSVSSLLVRTLGNYFQSSPAQHPSPLRVCYKDMW